MSKGEKRERQERESRFPPLPFLLRSRRIESLWVAPRNTSRPLFTASFSEPCSHFLPEPTPVTMQ